MTNWVVILWPWDPCRELYNSCVLLAMREQNVWLIQPNEYSFKVRVKLCMSLMWCNCGISCGFLSHMFTISKVLRRMWHIKTALLFATLHMWWYISELMFTYLKWFIIRISLCTTLVILLLLLLYCTWKYLWCYLEVEYTLRYMWYLWCGVTAEWLLAPCHKDHMTPLAIIAGMYHHDAMHDSVTFLCSFLQ